MRKGANRAKRKAEKIPVYTINFYGGISIGQNAIAGHRLSS